MFGNTPGLGIRSYTLDSRGPKGVCDTELDQIAEEKAVAMVYNGISHAVMMATPLDFHDFALGFSLTEGIIDSPDQLRDFEVLQSELGFEARMEIASAALAKLKARRRQLGGRTGCGICGLESLEAFKPTARIVKSEKLPAYEVVSESIRQLQQQQPLRAQCGAVHAAAYIDFDGNILNLREDLGRHNALDKLLGALARQKNKESGFVLISSRASFEMVSKTASQSIATLVSVSAPTDMAIELAKHARMNLIGFVRPERQLIYSQFDTKE